MKTFRLVLTACLTLTSLLRATPDWAETYYENFLGSNDDNYATMKTVIDNQGSHYSWKETKILTEYAKSNNAIINSQTVSDILYNIDASHDDPNTSPKVTKKILESNDTLTLATVTKEYHLEAIPTNKETWVNRLSWDDSDLILDGKQVVLSKKQLENMEVLLDHIQTKKPSELLVAVNHDSDSFYLTMYAGRDVEEGSRVICLPTSVTKVIRDREFIRKTYPLLGEYDSQEDANKAALEVITLCHNKNFFSVLPEIWSVKKDDKLKYIVVQHPLKDDKIKELEIIFNKTIPVISSDNFIQKWRPYAPLTESNSDSEDGDEVSE